MDNPIDRMSPLVRYLHLAVFVGFAISQPLYDLLAAQAEFFVARQRPDLNIYLTVIFVSLLIPALLLVLTQFSSIKSARSRDVFHAVVIGGLAVLFALVAIRQNAFLSGYGAFIVSFAIGGFIAVVYHNVAAARSLVTFMSPAILIFPAVFLFADNISMLRSTGEPHQVSQQAGADTDTAERAHPPVVMVLFDELALNALLGSDGELDAIRYPHFAQLAGESTWFRNATTVAPVTNYAVPAILSGRYPNVDALPVAFAYPQTLFSILQDTHVLNIQETVTRLCPVQSCNAQQRSTLVTSAELLLDLSAVYGHMAVPVNFSHWLPPLGHKWGGFVKAGNTQSKKDEYKAMESEVRKALRENLDSNRTVDLDRFLESIEPWKRADKPPLHFLHLLVPHRPWKYYPSGTLYTGEDGRVPGMDVADTYWGPDQNLADQGHQRYLMQVELADAWLGRIIATLKEKGLYSQALLVVVSDHGASFIAQDAARKLTDSNYAAVLPVPLFIKEPQQTQGRIDDSNMEVTDILPTLAQHLGVALPLALDGKPAGSVEVLQRETKRMYDFYSRWVNKPIDVDAALAGRSALIAQRISLFGEGEKGDLYGYGELSDYFGRALAQFPQTPASVRLSVDQASQLQDVSPDSGFIPGLISGSLLSGDTPPSNWVVLALNSVVSAAAPVYQNSAGKWVYSAVLPEDRFVKGHNSVEVFFAQLGTAGGVETLHLEAAGESGASRFWLEENGLEVSIVFENGDPSVALEPRVVHGYVDYSLVQDHSLLIRGWAIEPQAKAVASKLLIFANGKGVSQIPHNTLERADIFKHHDVAGAGFNALLPRSLLEEHAKLEIRVVAVTAGGRAGELSYIDAFDWRPGR